MTRDTGVVHQLNSQQQPTTEAILQFLAEIPRHIYDPAKRFITIFIQTRSYLDRPEIREYLQKALDRAPHNAASFDYERQARALLDTQKTLFPKPIKIKRSRPARSKTKINSTIRIDPELGRVAVALHLSSEFRLWTVVRDMIRQLQAEGKPDNYVMVDALISALKTHGINYTRANVRLLLKNGQNRGFWTIHAGRVYITGVKRVAAILTRMAIDNDIPVDRDKPGIRDWYIRVSGEIGEFNAHVYAAWLAANDNPTISRQTLQALWNRERPTLQTWERLAKIKTIENYAQTKEIEDPRIPDHAVSGRMRESAESTTIGYRWQRPNTYSAPKKLREHGHKGQARKVRKTVNVVCETAQHPDSMAGAHSVGVRNFDSLKAYRAAWRRDSRRDVPIDAHTDYLFLGAVRIRRRGKLIGTWELMGSREPQTSPGDYEPMPTYWKVQYGRF